MSTLDKVQSGQPMRIKAQTFNSILDATRAYQERQQNSGRIPQREINESNIVLVKNDSGVDANRFDVLGIDEPIVLPAENLSEFENRVSFSCSTPSESVHEGKFVVLVEPIKAGKIGRAYAAGVAVAWVYMEYDGQVLTRVDIRDGQTKLYPAENGAATALWYEPKTPGVWGDTRAIVRFGGTGAADICVQITATEANGGVYSQWREVELVDDDGLTWSPVADGLNGTDDGALYEINGVESVPENSVVKIFPNPSKDSDPDLPAWLFCYAESGNTGFGKPIAGETDAPVTNPYINLTVTDSAGVPILDDQGYEQQIKVWRNAMRTNLYTKFDSGTIFTYVRFPQPVGGVGGCIFSRTEPIQRYDLYKPADGYSVSGNEAVTPSTDITGNPADENHLHVRGMMYVEAGSKAFRPWFVIDPDLLSNGGKVKTDEDDTTAGFLDDEIIVLPDAGHNWITKTVMPGGENDNQLLLEHNDWDAENTTTVGSLISIEDAGAGITITPTGTLPPEGTAWFVFKEYEDEYDAKNHSRLHAKEGGLKYFIIDVAQFVNGKVKTDGNDIMAGYLDDEILVNTGPGNFWLTKTVIPGGADNNFLLLEHDEWNDSRISSTTRIMDLDRAGGFASYSADNPGSNYAYIKLNFMNVARDPAGHTKLVYLYDGYIQWRAAPEPTAVGDMIYAADAIGGLAWTVLSAGADQSLMYIDGGIPAWLDKGDDGSLLSMAGGALSWLPKGGDQAILHIDGDAPAWFECGGPDEAMLVYVPSHGLAWKPRGLDESIYITRNGELDWLSKGDDGSLLSVSAGALSWLAKGSDQSLMYMNGDAPAWFEPFWPESMLIVGSDGNLAWKPKGDDESIYITRNGLLDWLPKGDNGSLLSVAGGSLSWLAKGNDQALLHISGDAPAWFDANGGNALLTTAAGNLSWKGSGADQSIFISTAGGFDWFARGGNQSLLYVSGASLSWFGASSGNAVLTTAGGNLSWKSSGADQSIFISTAGGFNWFARGDNGSLLSVAGGNLSWLAKGSDQSLLYINGDTPAWFGAGGPESMLIYGSAGHLAWKPRGLDESVYITRAGALDWMSKGGDGSIFAVINGELTWLAPPTGEGKYFLTYSGGALAWEKGQEWSCP